MKKNFLLKPLTFILVLSSIVCFAIGCGESPHAHVYDQKMVTDTFFASSATCTTKTKYYFSCTCGAKGSLTFEHGEVLDHRFINYIYDENATCTLDGTKTAKCDNCDETDTLTAVGTKGHSFNNYVYDENATCTLDGTKTAKCDNCDETDTLTAVGTKGHSFNNYVYDENATCTEDGTKTAKCDRCDETDTLTVVGTKGHDYRTEYIYDESGHYHKCKNCENTSKKESHAMVNMACVCGYEYFSEGLKFTLNSDNKSYSVSKGTCKDVEIVIPNTNEGLPVTCISDWAFSGCKFLRDITIPSSVESIGTNAFYDCDSLSTVDMPNSLINIGGYAFSECGLLTSITIPNKVINIGEYAFAYCELLNSVEVSSSVTNIGEGAFKVCYSLTNISIHIDNANYKSIDGNLYSKDGKTLIQYAIGKAENSITIPNGVTSIADYAFNYCESLINVTMPNSIERIGDKAFFDCPNLTYNVKENLKYFGSESNPYLCLMGTTSKDLSTVNIDDNCKIIAYHAFYYCTSLVSIEIPSSVVFVGCQAFAYCDSLESIEIPDSVTAIDYGAFRWCGKLRNIYCEAESQPNGWDSEWKLDCSATVVWGHKIEN